MFLNFPTFRLWVDPWGRRNLVGFSTGLSLVHYLFTPINQGKGWQAVAKELSVSSECYAPAPLECSHELWKETILQRSPIKKLIMCLKLETPRSTSAALQRDKQMEMRRLWQYCQEKLWNSRTLRFTLSELCACSVGGARCKFQMELL